MKARLIYLSVLACFFAYYVASAAQKARHGHSWFDGT
jgi:hypothetical protein